MIKGTYTAIFISVLLHVILLLALIYSATTEQKISLEKPKHQPIKSFLYKAPKKLTIPPSAKDNAKANTETKKVITQTHVSKSQTPQTTKLNKTMTTPQKNLTADVVDPVKNSIKNNKALTDKTFPASSGDNRQQKPLTHFSSYDRLSQLRKNIESQQRQQAFGELTQKRSASSMDGEQFPVPKTIVPLTADQQYMLNTSISHVGSITKNDNGTCTIYREQILGSPVEATTATFACGESNFDKSFREHMQKVQAKLKH